MEENKIDNKKLDEKIRNEKILNVSDPSYLYPTKQDTFGNTTFSLKERKDESDKAVGESLSVWTKLINKRMENKRGGIGENNFIIVLKNDDNDKFYLAYNSNGTYYFVTSLLKAKWFETLQDAQNVLKLPDFTECRKIDGILYPPRILALIGKVSTVSTSGKCNVSIMKLDFIIENSINYDLEIKM